MSDVKDKEQQRGSGPGPGVGAVQTIFRDFLNTWADCRRQFAGPDAEALVAFRKAYAAKKWDMVVWSALRDCGIIGFILLNKFIAAAFLLPFRAIGYGLGFLPWGIRYAIGFLGAALILLYFCINGSSLFLLNDYGDLERYPDRNRNTIKFSEAGDYGLNMTVQLLDWNDEQIKMTDKLTAMQRDSEVGKEPPAEQLELVSKITGVPVEFLDGTISLSVKKSDANIVVNLVTEKLDGSRSEYGMTVENPTAAQMEAYTFFKRNEGHQFLQAQIPEFEKLLGEMAIPKGMNPKEIVSLKVVSNPACVMIQANVPPMENDEVEAIEEDFAEANTTYISKYRQYAAFREAETQNIVNREIEAVNKKNKELADQQDIKTKAELRDKGEAAIKAWQASHGRRPNAAEVKKIWEHFDSEFVPAPVLKVERATLLASKGAKGSQIDNLYEKRFKEVKFAKDNLRYAPNLMEIINENNLTRPLDNYLGVPAVCMCILLVIGAVISVLSTVLQPLRKLLYYFILSIGIVFALYWVYLITILFGVPDGILNAASKKEIFSNDQRNDIWISYLWSWLPMAVYSLFLWFPLLTFNGKKAFGIPEKKHDVVAEIAENMKCTGKSSGLYRSTYWVLGYYFFFLLVLPVLAAWLNSCVREDEYNIPKGDGGGQVAQVQVKKVQKKKKPKKRLILNPNSAFIFAMPDIPDEDLIQELDDQTSQEYQANGGGTFGPGKKKGGKPGWPNGMDNGMIRFIRLKYSGGDWDQDMGKGADYNMLIKIKEYTGFKIASETEFITVEEIETRFRKRTKKPPFVYITGRGGINMTTKEVKILRKYLLEDGGLLFADNGGGNFNAAIRNLIKRVLPNHDLVDIANDDMIYQQPFYFPNGAPRLWHHSGDRAMGIKNNGRWIVFYHQGDINDAWKTGGSGCSKQQQDQAYKMGANVIAYAFGEYLKSVYGDSQQ